ncbi:MAG: hypothetical protein ABFR47_07415 [Verrucomicrobiota bacterium]
MKKISIACLLIALSSLAYAATDEEQYSQWMQQGKNQVTQGNLEEARDSFQNALVFKPNDAEAQKGIRMSEERMARRAPAPQPKVSAKAVQKEEQKDFSIRVSLGSAPGIDEVDFFGSSAMKEDGGGQLEVLAVKRFWGEQNPNFGWVAGAGLLFAGHSGMSPVATGPFIEDADCEVFAFAGVLEGGGAVKIGNNVILEVTPFIGAGGAAQTITLASGLEDDSGASYICYGVKGGAFVLLGNRVELGIEAGYQGFSSSAEVEGTSEEVTFSGGGIRAAAVLAIKF